MPGVKQPCPMVAACWSPAMPQMRIAPPNRSGRVSPKSAAQSPTSGKRPPGMANSRSRSWSQAPRPISNNSVRDALVASVAWTLPPVSRQSRNESTVPNASRPCSAAARARFTWSSSQPILVAEKYGSSTRPVLSATAASCPAARSAAQASAVRRSCQTMALWIGLPLTRSQTIVVSRWLVMPMPAISLASTAGLGHGLADGRDHARPDFLRIVLDPSRRRIDLAQLLLRDSDRSELVVEYDRPRRGGALIDGDEVGRHGADADAFYDRPKGGRRLTASSHVATHDK